jgi:hypothetical protein
MLPDFPKVKRKYIEAIDRYPRVLIQQDPLFLGIREEHHFEGNRMLYGTMDGDINQGDYKVAKSESVIKREDIISKGVEAYLEQIRNAAEEMKRQKAETMFSKIREVTDRTGNVVNAKGRPLDFELYLEVLKKMWIDFDEDGKAILPTLVVSPEQGDKLQTLMPEWLNNPKFKETMEMKRKEWNDRESNRKLVD